MTVAAGETETVWVSVAATRQDLTTALSNPAAKLAAKTRSRKALADRSRVDLPGDRSLENAVEWGKQNLADLTQTASNLQIRNVAEGKAFPAPVGTVPSVHVHRRRLPRLPVAVRHRRRVHRVRGRLARAVHGDQGAPARPARRQRHPQPEVRQGRARDRHRRLGLLRRQRGQGQHRRVGQVPERGRAGVALDGRQPLPPRPLRLLLPRAALRRRPTSTPTRTAGPRASATSSARAWARRSSTTPST